MAELFDVIVVGGGHAGVEAALAAARRGSKTILISLELDKIATMSCNPSIGGLGKGHMVKEIDVLGGYMGRAADLSCIQYKRLNASKGPAVRGTRTQCDKWEYSREVREFLLKQNGLHLLAGEARHLLLDGSSCRGVELIDGSRVHGRTVVITTGTFMNAVIHIGFKKMSGGRVGEKATSGLSDQLRDHGLSIVRLKTGTPARLDRHSIDWSKLQMQEGEGPFLPFSIDSTPEFALPQIACGLSYTSHETHEVIRRNLDKSPMYCGLIEGIGPRYCPSIEDKVTRFPDKERHQTFLEPEGLNTNSIYLQGMSTSLPEDVQSEFIRTIAGLQNARLLRPGYAVEYDFIEPTQISHSLEVRTIPNLFLAGQINGTSGYEEAAAQGLVAGVNASCRVQGREPMILRRDQSYIGVLIDDLVTKGTKEPYRMMTARAEHRLVLREDNVIRRLIDVSTSFGLLEDGRRRLAHSSLDRLQAAEQALDFVLTPTPETNRIIRRLGSQDLLKPVRGRDLLRRPEIGWSMMSELGVAVELSPAESLSIETEVKYEGYIRREMELITKARDLEDMTIPGDLAFETVVGLSSEEREKLSLVRPRTVGQAGRVSGVNPSAVQALIVNLLARRRGDRRFKEGPSVS